MEMAQRKYNGAPKEKGGTSISGKICKAVKNLFFTKDGFPSMHLGTTILDVGAGKYDRNAKALRSAGYLVYSYDPNHGKPGADGWVEVTNVKPDMSQRFTVAYSCYVLNVVPEFIQDEIIREMETWASECYYVVRNDILSSLRGSLYKNKYMLQFFKDHFDVDGKYRERIENREKLSKALMRKFFKFGAQTGKNKFQRIVEMIGHTLVTENSTYKVFRN